MAILRCNKCGHVAELPAETIGKSVGCEKCGNEGRAYDTVLFVRKVLQQYFLLQGEVVRLSAALEAGEGEKATPPAAPSPGAALLADLDLHNTDQFASDSQHAGIVQWLKVRQVQARPHLEAVDTSGFFDDVPVELGDHFDLLREVVDKIRWGQQKEVPNFSVNLAKFSQKEGQAINAFCKRLHDYSLLSEYFYQKQEKVGRGTIQSAAAVRRFFAGEWLEWFAFMKLLSLARDRQREFSCARQLSLVMANEDLFEIDVFFLVDGQEPICIECKTGEFRPEIDKYLGLRKRLGVDRRRFIVCATTLTPEQAAGLSGMYELTFVNPAGLVAHLSTLV
ncbi:MAG: hypothetical protein JNJ44_01300 [Zoogloeaceae bacterium]|nr:hypothetical protein [Zoogloeaceae bacterium]